MIFYYHPVFFIDRQYCRYVKLLSSHSLSSFPGMHTHFGGSYITKALYVFIFKYVILQYCVLVSSASMVYIVVNMLSCKSTGLSSNPGQAAHS